MEAIVNMIRFFVAVLAVLAIAVIAAPIVIAVLMHASAALLIEIIVGEVIVLAVVGFVFLALFAQGMSR